MDAETVEIWDPWWWYRDVSSTIIAAIHDDWEGFRLILTGDKCPPTRVSIAPGRLVLYRVYDEIGLVGRNLQGLKPGHPFYQTNSSILLSEASKMNVGSYGGKPHHYCIYTGDRCIDMICTREPRFFLLREFAGGRYSSERPETDRSAESFP